VIDEETLPPADPCDWYLAFFGVSRMGWWDVLTKPGFRHVMAFAYSSHAERWLVYDVTRDRTYVRAYRPEAFDLWIRCMPPEVTILSVPAAPVERMRVQRAGFICTTAVKHLVGCRSRALRPQALYRDLLATGASHAFGTGPTHAST
jgi:hypothetical protein